MEPPNKANVLEYPDCLPLGRFWFIIFEWLARQESLVHVSSPCIGCLAEREQWDEGLVHGSFNHLFLQTHWFFANDPLVVKSHGLLLWACLLVITQKALREEWTNKSLNQQPLTTNQRRTNIFWCLFLFIGLHGQSKLTRIALSTYFVCLTHQSKGKHPRQHHLCYSLMIIHVHHYDIPTTTFQERKQDWAPKSWKWLQSIADLLCCCSWTFVKDGHCILNISKPWTTLCIHHAVCYFGNLA